MKRINRPVVVVQVHHYTLSCRLRQCYNLSTCHSHSLQQPLTTIHVHPYIYYISCALYTPLVLITTKTTYLTITQQYLLQWYTQLTLLLKLFEYQL